jgi:hypothetical protein
MTRLKFWIIVAVVLGLPQAGVASDPIDPVTPKLLQSGQLPPGVKRVAFIKPKKVAVYKAGKDGSAVFVLRDADGKESASVTIFTVLSFLDEPRRKMMRRLFEGQELAKEFARKKVAVVLIAEGRWGPAAYDVFPEEERPKLIADWEKETKRISAEVNQSMNEVRTNLALATNYLNGTSTAQVPFPDVRKGDNPIAVQKYIQYLQANATAGKAQGYLNAAMAAFSKAQRASVKLSKLERNDPPYVATGEADAANTTPERQFGELTVAGIKLGAVGTPDRIDAKVMQVIDANRMLVGIDDARTNNGRYETWVMVKCPTKGITDGQFWRGGQWAGITGSKVLEVTDTTTYKTVRGGSKTVFVLEPYKTK